MALSGDLHIRTISVNYNGSRGDQPHGGQGGGNGVIFDTVLGWDIDENNILRVHYKSESGSSGFGYWGICGTAPGYGVVSKVLFSEDGTNWRTLKEVFREVSICPTTTNVSRTLRGLAADYGPIQLTAPGYLKISYGANRPPGPSWALPISFPSEAISETDQTEIYIPVVVDYRPGERKINGTSQSLNRDGGVCDRKGYGEMKSSLGGSGTDDPPSRKASGVWYNQRKLGANQ